MQLFGPPDIEKMRAKRDISGLIKAMGYARDAKIGQAAATALGEIGDKQAVEPLIAAFRDKHPVLKDRREAVAKALGKIGDLRAVKPLVSAFSKDDDEAVRQAAIGALSRFGVRAVKPLVSALSEEEDETVEEAVIGELIKFGVPAIGDLLTELKNNVFRRAGSLERYRTRKALIKALLGIGPLCINALIDALEVSGRAVGRHGEGTLDFQIKVRRERAAGFNVDRYGWGTDDGENLKDFEEVLVALGAHSAQPLVTKLREKAQSNERESLGAQRALSDSIKALDKAGVPVTDLLINALQDPNRIVRGKFIKILADIKDPRAVEPIIAALRDEDKDVRDIAATALKGRSEQRAIEALKTREDKQVQVREILAEARLKTDTHSVKQLISLLQDVEIAVRRDAVKILIDIGDTQAVEPLIIALQDKDDFMRAQAALALGRIRDVRAVEPLIDQLNDRVYFVREASIQALGQIGDARAVEPVIAALKDGSAVTRAAARMLGQIRDARAVQPLTLALKLNGTRDLDVAEEIAKALVEISDKTGADTLLDYLFGLQEARPLHLSQLIPVDVLIGFPQDLKNFFGDYTQFITRIVSIKSAGHPESFSLHYTLDDNTSALEALCKIDTPLASNILHRVTNRQDITAPKNYYSESGGWTTHQLSLESLRNIAKAELLRRGNPPHDPAIYLNESAWKRESTFSVLPLSGLVVYPQTAIPLTVGPPRSINLVDEAVTEKRDIALVASKDPDIESPNPDDLYKIGTLVKIHRILRQPDGTIRILVQGLARIEIEEYIATDPCLKAKIREIPETVESSAGVEALVRNITDLFAKWAALVPDMPDELVMSILSVDDPLQLVYTVARFIRIDLSEAQKLLELDSTKAKLQLLVKILDEEIANNKTVITSSESSSGELPDVESPLAKGDDEELTRAISHLTSSDTDARFTAAMTLAKLRDDRGIAVLLLMLKNDDDVALDSVLDILYEYAYTPEGWKVIHSLRSGGSQVDLNALMKPEMREVFDLVESEAVDRLLKATSQVKSWHRDSPAIPMRKIIAIGKLLDFHGGKALMRNIHAEFSQRSGLGRELEVMWDGIGTWRG